MDAQHVHGLMLKCGPTTNTIRHDNFFDCYNIQDTISYTSVCVCGRMSDKEIVQQSSLLDHLLPGELHAV